jgi:hypothetical protein
MLLVVNFPCNLVLLLRIRDNLLALEPQLLRLIVFPGHKLVMGCGTTEAALLRSIGAVGILSVLQVEANLVEALFGHELVVLAKISAVDDGVD